MEKDEIVKTEIINQAQILFQQFGLKKTTMDEIASGCGKAKSTLYHYFTSKEDVFDAVIEKELVNLRKDVKNKVEEHKHMIDKISTYVLEFYKEVINKVNIYRVLKKEKIIENQGKKVFLRMMEFEKSYILRILEDGFDSGEYTPANREDLPLIAEMSLASIYGIMLYSIEKDGFIDHAKLQNIISLLVPKVFG